MLRLLPAYPRMQLAISLRLSCHSPKCLTDVRPACRQKPHFCELPRMLACAGARVSWRNAPKCGNRKFAMELKLLDKRGVTTSQVHHGPTLLKLNLKLNCHQRDRLRQVETG